ncbi:hypothetical protein [Chitiniphilus eburneus]|uniref:Uncharacterized protein n=1 Tax=Chitiniphilus eburneus TaxID=2571148 RepID=A0A4V5MRD8_9NEIS|nr:hypothetical protein [Chitiniphilus eburneus]TJZ75618.1 hypothetical protein FAZ21_06810 [Chitiniphilus eburneus]
MAHQFKPGDMARVIDARVIHENIGKIVELVQLLSPGEEFRDPHGVLNIYTGDEPAWLVVAPEITGVTDSGRRSAGFGMALPQYLMPLGGDENAVQDVRAADMSVKGGA